MHDILAQIKSAKINGTPVYIMPVGLPASGKTTFLVQLQSSLQQNNLPPLSVLSFDAIIAEFMAEQNISDYNKARELLGPEQSLERLIAARERFFENGENIYADNTNLTKELRTEIRQQIPNHHLIGIYFPITLEESIKRCATREKITGRHIPLEALQTLSERLTPPESHEFDSFFVYQNGRLTPHIKPQNQSHTTPTSFEL